MPQVPRSCAAGCPSRKPVVLDIVDFVLPQTHGEIDDRDDLRVRLFAYAGIRLGVSEHARCAVPMSDDENGGSLSIGRVSCLQYREEPVIRSPRLGGLLNYYERAAALQSAEFPNITGGATCL